MASGKSLELKQFDFDHREATRVKIVCTCGEVWDGPKHFTVKGQLRDAVAKDTGCMPTGNQGILIKAIEAKKANRKLKVPGKDELIGFEDK